MEKGGEPFTLLQTIATDPQSSPSQHGLSGTTYGSAIIPRPEPLSRRVLDEHVLFPPGMVQVCLQEPDRLFLIFRLLRGVNIHGRWGIHRSVHYHDLRCHLALARRLCRCRGRGYDGPASRSSTTCGAAAGGHRLFLPPGCLDRRTAPDRADAMLGEQASLLTGWAALKRWRNARCHICNRSPICTPGSCSLAARGPASCSNSIVRASAAGVALAHSPIQR